MTASPPTASRVVRIGLAQIRVEPGSPESNLARACAAIESAARQDCQVVVLPEALDAGWTHADAAAIASPIPEGAACQTLAAAARKARIHVAAGLTERASERVFNAAVLLDPDGRVRLHHRKIHELRIGHDTYALGDRLGVVDLPFARVGLMICADGFAPGEAISRALALMGAELILSPCAWAVPPGHDPSREPYGALWEDCHGRVAREHHVAIVATSCVGPIHSGPWAGHRCIGCSLITATDGSTLARAPYGAEALVICDVPLPTNRPRVGP